MDMDGSGTTMTSQIDPLLPLQVSGEAADVTTGNEQLSSDKTAETTVGETSNLRDDPMLQNSQRNEKFPDVPNDDVVDPLSEEQIGDYPMSDYSDESNSDSDEENLEDKTLYPLMLETDDLSDV
jgi:hypothetical protein